MKTFMVKYIKDNELKIAYVQGINQLEAQEKFLKDFSLEKDNIIEVTNLKAVKNNYKTATAITKFIAILGILSIIGGIVAILSVMGLPIGVGMVISGLFMIMGSQLTMANIDSANYTKQMLEESRYKK